MSIAISGRIDKAQKSFQTRLGQPVVASILRADIYCALLGQFAILKNIIKLTSVILIEKYIVPHHGEAIAFSMHRQGECRQGPVLGRH